MSLLEKYFAQIREVLRVTCELLGVNCNLPESYPAQWDGEFADGKITFQLAEKEFLRVSKYVGERLQVQIVLDDYALKRTWEQRMSPLFQEFSISTFGFLATDDHIVDLRTKEGRPMVQNPVLAATVEDERALVAEVFAEVASKSAEPLSQAIVEPQPTHKAELKCPHCNREIDEDDVEQEQCRYCDEQFWQCPRCSALLTEEPDGLDECPHCHLTYAKLDCPECNESVYADATKCGECGNELKLDACPHCERVLILSKELGQCPYNDCEEYIYICPRCDHYIDVDPEDSDTLECLRCHGTLIFIECPECNADILADATQCSRCQAKFEHEPCPNGECGKPIIVHKYIDDCPYCEADIILVDCRHCSKKSYVLDTYH